MEEIGLSDLEECTNSFGNIVYIHPGYIYCTYNDMYAWGYQGVKGGRVQTLVTRGDCFNRITQAYFNTVDSIQNSQTICITSYL